MKAVTYQGIKNVDVTEVKDPKIKNADDIIIKVTTSAICGSDLHLIHGMIPNLPLSEAKRGYEVFDTRTDDCIKVVLKP